MDCKASTLGNLTTRRQHLEKEIAALYTQLNEVEHQLDVLTTPNAERSDRSHPGRSEILLRKTSNRSVALLDDVLDQAGIERVHRAFSGLDFRRTEADRPDTMHAKQLAANLKYGQVSQEPLFAILCQAVYEVFADRLVIPYRAVINSNVYGDCAYTHRDCAPDRSDITALYFVNREWKPDWGGELIFFDQTGDASIVIAPRPGRVVLFEGAIEHRSGVPSRLCYVERLTLAYKFKTPNSKPSRA